MKGGQAMHPILIPFVLALFAVPLPGSATTTTAAAPGGRVVVPPRSKQEPAHTMTDDSAGLRRGALEAVTAKGTATVNGQALNFDPRKVRIFAADGKPRTVGALQKGAKISFTLDPRDASRQRIGVIYLQ
jgi:hypothetical protein